MEALGYWPGEGLLAALQITESRGSMPPRTPLPPRPRPGAHVSDTRGSGEFDIEATPPPDDPSSAFAWIRSREKIEQLDMRVSTTETVLAGFSSGVAGIMTRVDDLALAHTSTAADVKALQQLGLDRRVAGLEEGHKILHKLDKESAVQTKMLEHLTHTRSEDTSRFRFVASYAVPILSLLATIGIALATRL